MSSPVYLRDGRVVEDHPQVQTTLDTIGFQSRIGLVAVIIVIVSIVFGYGG